jgi:hypothetical protein
MKRMLIRFFRWLAHLLETKQEREERERMEREAIEKGDY